MNKRTVTTLLGIILLLGAGVVALSITAHLMDLSSIPALLTLPGAFLYERFLFASFYVAIYLICLSYIAFSKRFQRPSVTFLMFTLLPFVTAALLFHVLLNTEPNGIMRFFILGFNGRRPAALVLLGLLLIEILISYRFTLSPASGTTANNPERSDAEDGLFPLREHVDLGVDENLPDLEAVGAESLTLDRDEEGRMRFSSDEEQAVQDELEEAAEVESLPEEPERRAAPAARSDSAEDDLKEIVPEGEPGSLDSLYVNDANDPTIRGLVQDIIRAEVNVAPVTEPAVEEDELEVPEELDLEEIELAEEEHEEPEIPELDAELSFEDELDEVEDVSRDYLIDEDQEDTGFAELDRELDGYYEHDLIEEDQLAILEEKYGDDDQAPEADAGEELLFEEELTIPLDTEEVTETKKKPSDDGVEKSVPTSSPATDMEPHSSTPPKRIKKVPYSVPVASLLHSYEDDQYWIVDEETKHSGEVLRKTLEEFKIEAEVTGIRKGPVITMFEILPAPGVKLSKITNLADNIALRLAASSVRIVAPIPGKHAVGIEVPNHERSIVSFHEMIEDGKFAKKRYEIPVVLGKDITGGSQIVDLVNTPHLLIAGATGSGKSVCVNSLICSLLCKKTPEEVRLLLIDPKIVELKLYNDIPHLLTPVITEPKRAFQALQYCLSEMEQRYALLDSQGVRDIRSYNRKVKERKLATKPLPYIVIIVDEFADLMASTGKELESTLARLAAMSRAVGIHLVLATQRPSIDVITGLIKANIPSRIAFMVAGKTDSRIIIDAVGAEKLLGKGDMLFTSAWDPNPSRIQGAFLSEEEVGNIVTHVKTLGEPDYIDDEIFFDEDEDSGGLYDEGGSDPLMNKALEIVTQAGKASASYLQRRLKIGYNRAARLVEEMEHRGIVGPQNGSKPREILHIPDRVEEPVES